MRWSDHLLNWIPSNWGGVEMIYFQSSEVWKPDYMITNQGTNSTINIGKSDSTMVRVWYDNAPDSDLVGYNVEWSPYI